MLNGIRILDLTRYFPGPFATLRLQERGAEVVKIEDKNGDPARVMDSFRGEEGVIFRSMSRGKSCVSLNLKEEQDHEKFLKLVETADALIESFRPGVAKRLGIDYETLSLIAPKLVYVSLSGYGQTGSLAQAAGHDLNYMAYSGVLDQLLDNEGQPIRPKIAIADLVAGVAASEAIAVGLIKSARTGEGSYQDVSMTDVLISFMGLHAMNYSATGEEHGINDHGIGYGIFRTSDDRYIALCALEDRFFLNFCRGIGQEELSAHQHTEPVPGNPYYDRVAEVIAGHTLEDWVVFSRKVDCCMAPVLHTSELKKSPCVNERGLIEHKWDLDYVSTGNMTEKDFLNYGKPFHRLGEDNDPLIN